MAFDKEAYWHRRNLTRPVEVDNPKKPGKKMTIEQPIPQRGQDPLPAPVQAKWTQEDFKAGKCAEKEIGSARTPKNMEMRMDKKLGLVPFPRRDRRASKFGGRIKDGDRPFTKTGVNHTVGTPNAGIVLPRTDPKLSNHTRMLMRKQYRGDGMPKELAK